MNYVVSPEFAKQNTGGGGRGDREEENKQHGKQRGWGGRSNGTTLGSIPESKRHLVGKLVNKYVGKLGQTGPNTNIDAEISAPADKALAAYRWESHPVTILIKVAGAPIFTYTHEPDDNKIHNGCKTMLYYVRGALCKHTIMSFLYVSIQEK